MGDSPNPDMPLILRATYGPAQDVIDRIAAVGAACFAHVYGSIKVRRRAASPPAWIRLFQSIPRPPTAADFC